MLYLILVCSTAKKDESMKILNLTITSTTVNVTYNLGKSGLKYTCYLL